MAGGAVVMGRSVRSESGWAIVAAAGCQPSPCGEWPNIFEHRIQSCQRHVCAGVLVLQMGLPQVLPPTSARRSHCGPGDHGRVGGPARLTWMKSSRMRDRISAMSPEYVPSAY